MGYVQEQIINIGKEKGFVTSEDVSKFYQSSKISQEMNKLVVLGYFEKPVDCGTHIEWKFEGEDLFIKKVKEKSEERADGFVHIKDIIKIAKEEKHKQKEKN